MRGKLRGPENYAKRELSKVKYIVIHHSAKDVDSTPLEIANYHVDKLGWPGIGYHYVIDWSGAISYTGDLLSVRYNVGGRNRECIGICLPGNWMARWPWPKQLASAYRLVRHLKTLVPDAEVVGHRDIAYDNSECPGNSWPQWRSQVGP